MGGTIDMKYIYKDKPEHNVDGDDYSKEEQLT